MLTIGANEVPRARAVATPLDERAAVVLAARYGRIAFGLVLIVGMLGMAVVNVVAHFAGDELFDDGYCAVILVATWLFAVIAMTVSRAIARHDVRRRVTRSWPSLGASLATPGAGLALALPLTVHMPIAVSLRGLGGFDRWVHLSLMTAGFAHLVGASLVAYRGFLLARGETRPSLATVLQITTGAAMVPFGIFMFPVALVYVTGAICTRMLARLDTIALREHEALGGIWTRSNPA